MTNRLNDPAIQISSWPSVSDALAQMAGRNASPKKDEMYIRGYTDPDKFLSEETQSRIRDEVNNRLEELIETIFSEIDEEGYAGPEEALRDAILIQIRNSIHEMRA